MSNEKGKRYWEEPPVPPGSESAIDPETLKWKPKKLLREFEIGGHPIREVIGPMVQMNFTDETGRMMTINVPFDPADGDPDMEAIEADALDFAHDLSAILEAVNPEYRDEMVVKFLAVPKVGESGLAHELVSHLANIMGGSVKVSISDVDDLTPDQITALEEESQKLLSEKLPEIIATVADAKDDGGLTFWQDMATDIIAHATIATMIEARETLGYKRGDVPQLGDDGYQELRDLERELFQTGPYLATAAMQQLPQHTTILGTHVIDVLNRAANDGGGDVFAPLLKQARKNLALPAAGDGTPMPELHGDPLPKNQAGRIELTSLGTHQEVIKGIARLGEWKIKVPGGNPEHRLQGRNTDGHLYIEGGGAMRLWQELQGKSVKARTRAHRDILPDVLIAVLAIASARRGQLDLFGNGTAYLPIEWLAKTVGITGKLKPSDIDKLYTGLRVIGDIQMTGRRLTWIKGKSVEIPFIGPMWQIMETVPKVKTREEYERFLRDGPKPVSQGEYSTPIPPLDIAGTSLAIGAGLIATVDENPQFAQVVAKLPEYSPVHGRYKRWLGFVLSWIFRDRKKQQSWEQAFTVRWLLQEAGLPVDEKPINPQRPFNLFQEALETLQADGVIGEYRYPDEKGGMFKRGGRGWYPRWLDSRLVIMPPADVHAAYLESNRKALARSKKRPSKPAG